MTTLARRYAAVPKRTSSETWRAITEHLPTSTERAHFEAATNAAAVLIADSVTATTPIVLTGAGPRVHLYTVHGDDAISGHNVNEATVANLSFSDDWTLYLPDHPDEPGLIAGLVTTPHIKIGQPPSANETNAAAPTRSRVGVIDLTALEPR